MAHSDDAKTAFLDENLSAAAKGVYATLCAMSRDGVAFPSTATLARIAGTKSPHTLRRHLRALIDAGYLSREQSREGSRMSVNVYRVHATPQTNS